MITKRQSAALKYLVFKANGGSKLTKQIFFLLLDKSQGLNREVCLTISTTMGFSEEEIREAAVSYNSSNGTTHLHAIFIATGNGRWNFDFHYGDYDPKRKGEKFNNDGQFVGWSPSQVHKPGLLREGMPLRYTFWISKNPYSRKATLIRATRARLEKIDIQKSGLY